MEMTAAQQNDVTIIDHFIKLCQQNPNKPCFAFLDDKGNIQAQLSRIELHQAALSLADHLINAWQLQPGDCVLLVYPQSLDSVIALLACLYAGLIPAPIAPPNPFRDIKYDLEVFRRIAKNCQCKAILTNGLYSNVKKLTTLKNLFSFSDQEWSDLPWYRTDKISTTISTHFNIKKTQLTDTAYFQFTSGSTTDPKGVVITYSNLAHQLAVLSERLGFNEHAKAVIWVPQYHSTCLVSVVFNNLQNGSMVYFFSPLEFLKQPALWFETITRYQATHSTAPEFAIKKMLENANPNWHEKFDLSSLRMLCVGGEPNNYDVITKFSSEFNSIGFNSTAYTPGYGMTEHTLGIAMTHYNEAPYTIDINKNALLNENKFVIAELNNEHSDTITLVSNGKPLAGVQIKILNQESQQDCFEGEIGKIIVASPSVAKNYCTAPNTTGDTFSDTANHLSTGDLGSIFNGHLFVTGRSKDIIIINGRNIYLNDIDHLVKDCHPLVLSHQISALSVENKLVIILEIDKNTQHIKKEAPVIFANIRSILTKSLSIVFDSVLICKTETLLRTNTGKIRRHPTRDALQQGKLAHKIIASSTTI